MNSDAQAAQEVTRNSRSNFIGSFFFLPHDKKRGMEAVYAFCRLADDAVDESASALEANEKLKHWSGELEAAYHGSPTHPVMREIGWTVKRFHIPKKYFDELIEGVKKDLDQDRYSDFEELCEYTYGVASVVGLICMKIFEVEGEDADQGAILLGRALQVTNILRDIKSDAMRGRIYLPLNDLKHFSLSEDDILQGRLSVRFDSLMYYEIGQVETLYAEAFRLMKKFPRKKLVAAWIMGKVYYHILQQIKKDPRAPLREKVNLSKWMKLSIALKEWIRSWF
ncbi:MAG: squalene/phytoene synthase family protein [bacterium]